MLRKIISGGQTGVDRGALDAALAADFPCGGWCPKGRKAEDGAIPVAYPLSEMPGPGYRARTRRNVIDSDGTLIVFFRDLAGGTLETLRIAEEVGKPLLTIDGSAKTTDSACVEVAAFIALHEIETLNVAGPRESSHTGAATYANRLIASVLDSAAAAR